MYDDVMPQYHKIHCIGMRNPINDGVQLSCPPHIRPMYLSTVASRYKHTGGEMFYFITIFTLQAESSIHQI